MTDDERLEALRKLSNELEVYSAHCLKIKDKSSVIRPFIWNKAQRFIHERLEAQLASAGMVRALILKSRQQGSSTYVGARFYHKASMRGKNAFIVAHEDKATSNLYSMVRRFHDNNPIAPSTGATNAKELIFDKLDGGYKLATAGTKDVGRSNTAQLLHGCLGAGAGVLMADGTRKTIETLEPGDRVRTRRGFEAPVRGISWHTDLTREVRVAMNGEVLRATDGHKFWTRAGMRRLDELQVGDELGFPVREITGEIGDVEFAIERSCREQGGGREMLDVPQRIALTYEVGRMLGLYLAEGHVALQSKAPHNPASVVFACHERELTRNTAWVHCVGGFSSISERGNKGSLTRMTTVYGRQFASFVLRMCGRNGDKHLPHEWWRMPHEFVRGMLIGYLAGDGHSSVRPGDRRISAPSVVPAVAYGMRDVVAALGLGFPAIAHRPGAVRNGRKEQAQWTLRITGAGVDELVAALGWSMPPRQRAGRSGVRIENGCAWLPIESIGEYVEETVWDIEVDHPDHDYCLTQCATSNSEFGFWANAQDHLAGIGNTIGDVEGTEIILESTGNGLGNAFHLLWQDAERGFDEDGNPFPYIAIFVPWFWQEEYAAPPSENLKLSKEDIKYQLAYGLTLPQMQWRANKIATYGKGFAWLFDQEYPATAALAFQSATLNPLISPNAVATAVNSGYHNLQGPLVIGCDPAGDGAASKDRTAIAFRRGRVCFRIEYHSKLNTMQVAGKLAEYWRDMQPDAMFVDKTGIGAGVVDRLNELNIPAIGVNNGESARQHDIYENRGAEVWWAMQEWFDDEPARIPNDPALISDLLARQPGENTSRGLKQLESKRELKKRGIRSPDGGDALALTFAEPVAYRAGSSTYAGSTGGGYSAASDAGY